MSSNITGVEKKELESRFEREWGGEGNGTKRVDIPSIRWFLSRMYELGRLDGGAFVADRVEEQAKEDRCDGDHEEPCTICAMDSVADDLVETVKDALSVLEKEAKGEKE